MRDRPAPPPTYLLAEEQRVSHWRRELSGLSGFRVAIHWHGNASTNQVLDRETRAPSPARAVPLECFAPLAALQGVRLVSVQQGDGAEELERVAFAVENLGPRLDADGAFLDTAAVLKNMDLFVTSDSGPAHVAGALGVPTLLLLPQCACRRWDTPLYPSVCIFRVAEGEDWSALLRRVALSLRCRIFPLAFSLSRG